jgi:hypothetical protein
VQAILPKFETSRMPMSSQLNAVAHPDGMGWAHRHQPRSPDRKKKCQNGDPHEATMSGDDLYHLFSVILGDGSWHWVYHITGNITERSTRWCWFVSKDRFKIDLSNNNGAIRST